MNGTAAELIVSPHLKGKVWNEAYNRRTAGGIQGFAEKFGKTMCKNLSQLEDVFIPLLLGFINNFKSILEMRPLFSTFS